MTDSKTEIWRPVVGFESFYEVSSLGKVRSLDRTITKSNGVIEAKRGRVLCQGTKPTGYRFVNLCVNKVQKCCNVHRLVAMAFIPTDQMRREVNHIDGIKNHNEIENLEWVSKSENQRHAIEHGLHPGINGGGLCGMANGSCKLSPSDVLNVRRMRREGMTFREIGQAAKISAPHAYRLVKGHRQSQVKEGTI